jgi:hypothetical protein
MVKLIKKSWPVLALFVLVALTPSNADAAVSGWHKSVSMVPRNTTDYGSADFRQSITNLDATGANYVTLIIPYFQSNRYTTDLGRGWNTPTDESLVSAINYIHSLGMDVNLKIHIEMYTGEWRALVDPSDRDTWFRNYGGILNHYGRIGAQNGVEMITVGTELIRMSSDDHNSTNTANWRTLIRNLRAIYSGELTYSANWGESFPNKETTRIQFWDELDFLGISAYYYLNREWNNNSVDSFVANWENWNNTHIKPFQQQWNKPVLFSEVGYRSYTGSHTQPWEWAGGGEYNGTEQANAYEALFRYWDSQGFMIGVSFWDWEINPNAGGSGNQGYTPQNKPAQQVMTSWFTSGSTGNPTPPPPPSGVPSFTSTASVSPTSPVVNQPVTFNVGLTNTGQAASNLIVDLEIYNSSSQRVFQKVYEGQSFTASQNKTFTESFTPTAAGTYSIMIGVFNSNWSANYYWKSQMSFAVGAQTTPPPPAPTPTPTPTPSCATVGTNTFFACYYDNQDLTGLKVTRTETPLNFDWGGGSPDSRVAPDTFSAQWVGNFTFEAASYNFTVTADDGARLYVDNVLVLDKWIDQAPTTYNVARTMTAGSHQIKMLYYEGFGGATAKLAWTKQTITPPPPAPTPTPTPTPTPSPTCSTIGSNAFFACYYDNQDLTGLKVTRTDAAINFEWGGGSPDPSIGTDTFSAQWVGNFAFDAANYNFTTVADDGVRVYIDNALVLDKWIDQAPTTYNFAKSMTAGSHQVKMQYYENGGGATAKFNWTKSTITPTPTPFS